MSWSPNACRARRRANFIAGVGATRSTMQTTAQALVCTSAASPPRISVAALFQLAQWCQQRLSSPQGGTPCPTTSAPVSPPISSGPPTAAATEPALAATLGPPAPATLPGAERTGGSAAPAGAPKGGDA